MMSRTTNTSARASGKVPGLPADQIPTRRDLLKAGTTVAALLIVPAAISPKEPEVAVPSATVVLDSFIEVADDALDALYELHEAYWHHEEIEEACSELCGPAPSRDVPPYDIDGKNWARAQTEWVRRRHRVNSELGLGAARARLKAARQGFVAACEEIREVPATTLPGTVAKARLANADAKMLPFLLQDLQEMEAREREARAHG